MINMSVSSGKLKTPVRNFRPAFDQNDVPLCLRWTVQDVEEWIANELKFPQYKECFSSNFITGKKLIHMEASNLPRIGITDFEHIEIITSKLRELLGTAEPDWNRPIHLPPRDTVEHFIERKSVTGKDSNALTYQEHDRYLKEYNRHGVPERK